MHKNTLNRSCFTHTINHDKDQTLLGNPLHGGPKLLGGPKLPGRVYYGATMADQLCHGAMVPWYYHGT